MNIVAPKGEIVWVRYCNTGGEPVCIITSKPARDFYFLYDVKPDGSLQKVGKARSPTELEDKFDVRSKMRA